jgi:hypothetical protein
MIFSQKLSARRCLFRRFSQELPYPEILPKAVCQELSARRCLFQRFPQELPYPEILPKAVCQELHICQALSIPKVLTGASLS